MSRWSREFWRKHEKDCPFAEGNRCFIQPEPNEENCKGCIEFEWYQKEKRKNDENRDREDTEAVQD